VGFVLAGTQDQQDRALCALGARPVADCPLFAEPKFSDEVRLLYFDAANAPETMERRIQETMTNVRMPLRLAADVPM
jgi:hypothetical protein